MCCIGEFPGIVKFLLKSTAPTPFGGDMIQLTQIQWNTWTGDPGYGFQQNLVGSCPGWEAAFSDIIRFQCNYSVFWCRCACEHALLLGLYLKIDDGGIACVPP